jgi:hypothetical protein
VASDAEEHVEGARVVDHDSTACRTAAILSLGMVRRKWVE